MFLIQDTDVLDEEEEEEEQKIGPHPDAASTLIFTNCQNNKNNGMCICIPKYFATHTCGNGIFFCFATPSFTSDMCSLVLHAADIADVEL